MKSEPLIKGRIAESIIELLLEENDYVVRKIGREGLLNGISRSDIDFSKLKPSGSAGKISTAPSLAIFDKKGKDVVLAKVKFRGEVASGRNVAQGVKQLQEYWPEAVLVVVSSAPPIFRVIESLGDEQPIEKVFAQIKKESLRRFEGIVRNLLKN